MRKHTYEEKLRAQLDRWQASIDRLKGRIEEASVETPVVVEQQIRDLQAKQQAARRKLKQFDRVGRSRLEGGSGAAGKMLRRMRQTIEKIVSGGK